MDLATEWWGHSPEHGWVFFDRRLEIFSDLLIYRCRDGKFIRVQYDHLKPPEFVYAPRYLETLLGTSRTAADEQLELAERLSDLVKPEYEGRIEDALSSTHAKIVERDTKVRNAIAEQERSERDAAESERHKIRSPLVAHIKALSSKYFLVDDDLLSPDDLPTWVYYMIEKMQSGGHFSDGELSRLRESPYNYFAAAAHWKEWEAFGNPWNAVHCCSQLRKAEEPRKALRLLASVDFESYGKRMASALFTTNGGAQRDLELLDKAWASAQAAIAVNDDTPHPFMLLGALCYQTDRHTEGDEYFLKARERGASDKAIDFEKREGERRRIAATRHQSQQAEVDE